MPGARSRAAAKPTVPSMPHACLNSTPTTLPARRASPQITPDASNLSLSQSQELGPRLWPQPSPSSPLHDSHIPDSPPRTHHVTRASQQDMERCFAVLAPLPPLHLHPSPVAARHHPRHPLRSSRRHASTPPSASPDPQVAADPTPAPRAPRLVIPLAGRVPTAAVHASRLAERGHGRAGPGPLGPAAAPRSYQRGSGGVRRRDSWTALALHGGCLGLERPGRTRGASAGDGVQVRQRERGRPGVSGLRDTAFAGGRPREGARGRARLASQ